MNEKFVKKRTDFFMFYYVILDIKLNVIQISDNS
jgi:hypothetical protein